MKEEKSLIRFCRSLNSAWNKDLEYYVYSKLCNYSYIVSSLLLYFPSLSFLYLQLNDEQVSTVDGRLHLDLER